MTVNVLCIKWGNKYGCEYVNRLASMVARNLSQPHRFVCLTEDPTGIDDHIEVLPMPITGDAELDARVPWTRAHGWLKVLSFCNPLHDLVGPTLFIDLDVVIVDRIDCFFEVPGEFLVIREWDKRDGTGNTSVYRFEAGKHPDVLSDLIAAREAIQSRVRNEQEYVTRAMRDKGVLSYWPDSWCRSFKRHCVRPFPRSWFEPPVIPTDARIIAFHGRPYPEEAQRGVSGKWYRRVLPTAWIGEHWR